MRDYRRLKVWRRAHDLTLRIYGVTSRFPRNEMYGLTSQIRRASASIGANIAEGYGRVGDRELGRYLGIALSSSSELSYHLLLAKDLEYLDEEQHKKLEADLDEIQRMLAAFKLKLDQNR